MGFGKKLGRGLKKFGRTLRRGIKSGLKHLGRGGRNLLQELGQVGKEGLTAMTANGLEKVTNTRIGNTNIGDIIGMSKEMGRDPNQVIQEMGGSLGQSAVFNPAASSADRVRVLQRIGASAESPF